MAVQAHTVNSEIVLCALAAQKLPHLLTFRCRNAAKEPVIQTSRSEQEMANSDKLD